MDCILCTVAVGFDVEGTVLYRATLVSSGSEDTACSLGLTLLGTCIGSRRISGFFIAY